MPYFYLFLMLHFLLGSYQVCASDDQPDINFYQIALQYGDRGIFFIQTPEPFPFDALESPAVGVQLNFGGETIQHKITHINKDQSAGAAKLDSNQLAILEKHPTQTLTGATMHGRSVICTLGGEPKQPRSALQGLKLLQMPLNNVTQTLYTCGFQDEAPVCSPQVLKLRAFYGTDAGGAGANMAFLHICLFSMFTEKKLCENTQEPFTITVSNNLCLRLKSAVVRGLYWEVWENIMTSACTLFTRKSLKTLEDVRGNPYIEFGFLKRYLDEDQHAYPPIVPWSQCAKRANGDNLIWSTEEDQLRPVAESFYAVAYNMLIFPDKKADKAMWGLGLLITAYTQCRHRALPSCLGKNQNYTFAFISQLLATPENMFALQSLSDYQKNLLQAGGLCIFEHLLSIGIKKIDCWTKPERVKGQTYEVAYFAIIGQKEQTLYSDRIPEALRFSFHSPERHDHRLLNPVIQKAMHNANKNLFQFVKVLGSLIFNESQALPRHMPLFMALCTSDCQAFNTLNLDQVKATWLWKNLVTQRCAEYVDVPPMLKTLLDSGLYIGGLLSLYDKYSEKKTAVSPLGKFLLASILYITRTTDCIEATLNRLDIACAIRLIDLVDKMFSACRERSNAVPTFSERDLLQTILLTATFFTREPNDPIKTLCYCMRNFTDGPFIFLEQNNILPTNCTLSILKLGEQHSALQLQMEHTSLPESYTLWASISWAKALEVQRGCRRDEASESEGALYARAFSTFSKEEKVSDFEVEVNDEELNLLEDELADLPSDNDS